MKLWFSDVFVVGDLSGIWIKFMLEVNVCSSKLLLSLFVIVIYRMACRCCFGLGIIEGDFEIRILGI